jgi:hypothetical protein
VVRAPANRHDSPLPESACVHLDAGYDSGVTRMLLAERGLQGVIAHKGLPATVNAHRYAANSDSALAVEAKKAFVGEWNARVATRLHLPLRKDSEL